ncbi:MAG: ABC-F family ATP-binding cassette domain-containing protein [Opitutales bacterium]|nr:ABC-F family ATP-binding cassette domain-containing protein [Opitutales bacterium]
MVDIKNISLRFGDRKIFDNISVSINKGDKIALVGVNGAGKSTLLKVLANQEGVDAGEIATPKYATMGYLPQEIVNKSEKPLFEEAESVFADIVNTKKNLQAANDLLQTLDKSSPQYIQTLEAIGEMEIFLDDADADRLKPNIEKILSGLGFENSDMQKPCCDFSGGWQMRIALAKLLLAKPSLLMLDEPTNHLDIESVDWLENYLKSYSGALVIVSHDRRFIDNLANRTFALIRGRLDVYEGNYSFYEKESQQRAIQREKAVKNQEREIARVERFIDKFRYKSSKAAQVQSRIKALDKIERVESDTKQGQIAFKFPEPERSGQLVASVKNLCKSFGEKVVLKDVSFDIQRLDRIAIVGVNGAGKSTLVKIMAGEMQPDSGGVQIGQNVIISYFAQHQTSQLRGDYTVMDEAASTADFEQKKHIRTLLGSFMFTGDDALKKVAVLSGGEKNRLALAKMLLKSFNFLILDEPTNHLDMDSKKVLRDAVASYKGTVLIVSHDRDFIDPLVNKVIEISHGKTRTFIGNVSEYLEKVKAEKGLALPKKAAEKQVDSAKQRRINVANINAKIAVIKKDYSKIESQITELESEKELIEADMGNPDFYKDAERSASTANRYSQINSQLEDLYKKWEIFASKIDELEKSKASL